MPELTFKEIKDGVDAIGTAFNEFKSTNDANLKTRDALLETKLTKITEDLTVKYGEVKASYDALEAKTNRPLFANQEAEEKSLKLVEHFRYTGACLLGKNSNAASIDLESVNEYVKAYGQYLRTQEGAISPEIRKAMSVGSDPDGGYWIAPPQIDQQIRTRIFETSPMRAVCDVQAISTHEYKVPEDPNELSVGWVGETQSRPETTTPKVATKVITAHEVYAQPKVSRIMLEDSAINTEAWLSGKVGDKIGRFTNTSFLFGTGVAQSRGMLTYPAGSNGDGSNKWGEIEQIISGVAGTFGYDSLIRLITSLKDPYQSGASFLVRRQSVADIMTLKDGGGRYIFQPILNGAFNNTPLFGYPLNYASDMQATGTTGNLLMAFGDFKRGYMIVDRIGISTLRDELTAKPFVLFYTRMRVGGDVVDYDAIKIYKAT